MINGERYVVIRNVTYRASSIVINKMPFQAISIGTFDVCVTVHH